MSQETVKLLSAHCSPSTISDFLGTALPPGGKQPDPWHRAAFLFLQGGSQQIQKSNFLCQSSNLDSAPHLCPLHMHNFVMAASVSAEGASLPVSFPEVSAFLFSVSFQIQYPQVTKLDACLFCSSACRTPNNSTYLEHLVLQELRKL